MSASWFTATNPSVHFVSEKVWRSPVPLRSKRGRSLKPTRFRNGSSTRVCVAIPSVEPIPSTNICGVVNATDLSPWLPHTKKYVLSTQMEITLLAMGAHIMGPNLSRAFKICDSRKNAP